MEADRFGFRGFRNQPHAGGGTGAVVCGLLKQSKLPNALIPFVLAALGAVAGVLIDGPSANSVVQGILAAAAAVFGHQAVKQGTTIVARQSHDEPGPAA